MNKFRWTVKIIMVLSIIVSACSSPATQAPATEAPVQPTPTEAKPCTVKIAMVGPLTGDAAFWGNQMVRGASLAIDQINTAGGIKNGPYKGCTFEVSGPYDDRADPTEATNIVQKLTTMNDVLAMIGPVNSSNGFAILPILAQARIPVISGGASNADLTKHSWDNFFRAFLNDGGGATFVAKLFGKLGYKRIVVAYSNNDYGTGIFNTFSTKVKELGIEILSADTWKPSEDREFSPLITRWQSQNPDAIFIAGEYTESGLIVKQSRVAGMKQPIINQGAYGPDFLKIVGEQGEGVIVETLFDPLRGDEVTQKFVKQYHDKYNEDPAENGSIGYDAMLVLNDATNRMTEPGREALIVALKATKDFRALNYVVSFDETGEMVVPDNAPLVIIHNGAYASYNP